MNGSQSLRNAEKRASGKLSNKNWRKRAVRSGTFRVPKHQQNSVSWKLNMLKYHALRLKVVERGLIDSL